MGIIPGKGLNTFCAPAFMCLPLFKFFVLQSYFHETLPRTPVCIWELWCLYEIYSSHVGCKTQVNDNDFVDFVTVIFPQTANRR